MPNKYECPLHLKGYGIVYPDFTFLSRKTKQEIYWEHDGRMDDPGYAQNAVRKILAYEENGIYPGESLILTFETEKKRIEYKDHRKTCSQIFIMTYEEAKIGVLTTIIQRMTCRNFQLRCCCQSAQPPLRFLPLPCRLENSFSVMNLKIIVSTYWYEKIFDIYLILSYYIFYKYLIIRICTNLQTEIYKGEVPADLCVFYS